MGTGSHGPGPGLDRTLGDPYHGTASVRTHVAAYAQALSMDAINYTGDNAEAGDADHPSEAPGPGIKRTVPQANLRIACSIWLKSEFAQYRLDAREQLLMGRPRWHSLASHGPEQAAVLMGWLHAWNLVRRARH